MECQRAFALLLRGLRCSGMSVAETCDMGCSRDSYCSTNVDSSSSSSLSARLNSGMLISLSMNL